ncbi:MAG TPA: hypothetical protein ENJ15_03305 [Caldithrix abyssi]|uniref:DUF3823 domain-containing protein n=1 Tax=Caldithrix abyssi TaxID=187145 RepID=A0A7V5RNU2_CALAY|nr:hypothetical protein [Caldithrix abyssi]
MRFLIRAAVLLLLTVSCTENFLFDDEITPVNTRSVEGYVQLRGETDHGGIYVYLEGFDVETYTDAGGYFKLEIPQNPRLQPGQGVDGAFYIWYYVDNYRLMNSLTLVRGGQFSYGHADINDEGRLKKTVVLPKLLDITTSVSPERISEEFDGVLQVNMTLKNLTDSVYVNVLERKFHELGGVYLINNPDSSNIQFVRLENAANRRVLVDSVQYWQMLVSRDSLPLFPGKYEVLPFVKLYHKGMPDVLREKFGSNASTFSREFLNLPRKVSPALLTIGRR